MSEKNLNRDIAVKVSGVKKMYKLGQIGGGTLKADLQSWWARKRGKEDPNSIIGEEQRSHGDTFMALNGIDMTIYQGEAVGIIGSNGAGKSTLLKLLSRVTAPTEGEIDIYGRIASMLEVGTGFNGELTGRENVYMNGAILGMTKAEIDAKMEDIIEFSEVREFIDTPVKRYSSGMFVKLAFSVAAHLDAEIMIMDEVLAVGDMAFQKKCLGKMREAAKKEGRTVLYVSHNMNTIRSLCDRCIVLDKGKVAFEGETEKAIQVYLGNRESEDKFNFIIERDLDNITGDVIINDLNIIDGKHELLFGSKLRFNLDYSCKRVIKELHFRFCIYLNDGSAIATSMSEVVNSQMGNNSKDFEIDLAYLAPERYILKIIAIEMDGYGSQLRHDCINRAISFDVYTNNQLHNFHWDTKWWGHYVIPDAKVTNTLGNLEI